MEDSDDASPRQTRLTRRQSFRAVVVLVLAAISMVSTSAEGSVFYNGVRLQDEIVVVNVRALCGSCSPQALEQGLRLETYAPRDESGRRAWMRSDLASFATADPAVKTVIFVHGNQITAGEAKEQGLAVYRRLVHFSADDEPIRFVIFSWPSARTGGLLRDVREKAARTGPAGCQLAWVIDQLPGETPVSLVGFSFGARIITGALHILAGGEIHGCALVERRHPDRTAMNVVLMSAAVHAHWLGEGQYHGLAMTQVDQMLLLNNCADPAMRYYRFIDRSRPQALGYRGPICLDPYSRSKIQMFDLSRQIGSEHDLYCFLRAGHAMAMTWDYASYSGIAPMAVASQ